MRVGRLEHRCAEDLGLFSTFSFCDLDLGRFMGIQFSFVYFIGRHLISFSLMLVVILCWLFFVDSGTQQLLLLFSFRNCK